MTKFETSHKFKVKNSKMPRQIRSRSNQSGHGKREGDWTCASCGANCFAARSDCYKCGASKPSGGDGKDKRRKNKDGNRRNVQAERPIRSNSRDRYREPKLNMQNMMGESPPQQENDFLSFITERFREQDKLVKMTTQDQVCDWFKFSTDEKHLVESFVSCKMSEIDRVTDYICGKYNHLGRSTTEDILSTVTVIKDDFSTEKVENDVIRSYYLYNLNDMVKIKQGGSKYTLGVKMKTLCIHLAVKQICRSRNIVVGLAK